MHRIFSCLFLALTFTQLASAGESESSTTRDYNLSMAGALINDRCEKDQPTSQFISIHACNYQLAQLYSLDISSVHFDECATVAGGDIVKIADCMVEQFNSWLGQQKLEGISAE